MSMSTSVIKGGHRFPLVVSTLVEVDSKGIVEDQDCLSGLGAEPLSSQRRLASHFLE